MKTISEKLHEKQKTHQESVLNNADSRKISRTWFKKDTVDFWRHNKMRKLVLPIVEYFPDSSWLTVGDGRYGTDANFLLNYGVKVHASDIQDKLLRIGNEKGFIKNFSKQNAEELTFQNDEFDFVYCKESYHHFPRPSIAVYEMLRVAKKGIMLQEPKDPLFLETPWQSLLWYVKEFIKFILKIRSEKHPFEESGNYVYSLSPRELQKFALGINCRFIAYTVQQDYYIKGVEFEKKERQSKLFKKIKRIVWLLELLYKIGLATSGLMTGIILKDIPDEKLISNLKKSGYKTEILTKNPYT